MTSGILRARLAAFRKAAERLKEARDAEFKAGRAVRVNRESGHHLYGLVTTNDGCPLDQLAVRLENGNVWWYPLDDCHAMRRDDCSPWLQPLLKKDSVVSVRALTRHLKNEGW